MRQSKFCFSMETWLSHTTDWLINNVLFRPGVHDGTENDANYWPVPRVEPKQRGTGKVVGMRDLFYKSRYQTLKEAGLSDDQIEERFQQWAKGYQGPEKIDERPQNFQGYATWATSTR